jgi:hypothetical protein
MSQHPTLSGAQHGRVRPWREVPGGLYLDSEEMGVSVRPCALRILREPIVYLCTDYARQYLSSRGDKSYIPGQLVLWSQFFQLHFALIEIPQDPGAKQQLLFAMPPTLADEAGRLNPILVPSLPLNEAADGQLGRLWREYELLKATETPVALTHEKWEAIVNEGKSESLRSLHLRHGSSALIQVLHGMSGEDWPE